jgi:hypothetical protein
VSLPQDDKGTADDKIKQMFLRLKKKENFAKVAQDSGLSLKETGLFAENDSIPGIGWSPQITNLVAKTKVGEYLSPIQFDKNYYILKVKERKEPYIPEFEAIKNKVREKFIKDRSHQIAKEKIDACFKELKELYRKNPKSADFNRAGKIFGLKSAITDLFKFDSYIEGVGASDDFWIAAQKLKNEEFSEIIEIPTGFYIIKVKSRTPIDEKKFAAEKGEFGEKLLLQKKEEAFVNFSEDLKRKTQRF